MMMIVVPIVVAMVIVVTTVTAIRAAVMPMGIASTNIAIATEVESPRLPVDQKNRSPRAAIFFARQTTNRSSAPRNPAGIATG